MNVRPTAAIAVLALLTLTDLTFATTVLPPVLVGTFVDTRIDEASGIVESRSLPGVLWTHNDSGDSARFFAASTGGTILGVFNLSGASAFDWEDIALGPKSGGGNYLYLGDIGDNDTVRSEIAIYRVDEPQIATGATIAATDYSRARLQYPDGPHNAESLIVDPLTGELYIVTKSAVGSVYRASADTFDHPGQLNALESLGHLTVPLHKPSAADISPDGSQILIRDRSTTAYLFERAPDKACGTPFKVQACPSHWPPKSKARRSAGLPMGRGFTPQVNGAPPDRSITMQSCQSRRRCRWSCAVCWRWPAVPFAADVPRGASVARLPALAAGSWRSRPARRAFLPSHACCTGRNRSCPFGR